MTEPVPPTDPATPPVAPRTSTPRMEDKMPPSIWIRLVIYVAVGHLVAAFIWLLFEVGAK
ncbi:DUF6126 family protein [Streptomyces sp. NPDC049906]|uniref:DUF6126 family protein n=1 Tax=Streptomyces sp. NPDC049906 TaxID=3155656 RepID=UPI00344A5B1A